jgi:hypothetical protein
MAFGSRQWNALVISRPQSLTFLRAASEKLITKPSPFPTSLVYHPDKLGKFLDTMTKSEWLMGKEYSWKLLEDAFEQYRTLLNLGDDDVLGAIERQLQSRSKESILTIKKLFESLAKSISEVYARRLAGATQQTPRDLIRIDTIVSFAGMLRAVNEQLSVELITDPILHILTEWSLKNFTNDRILSVDGFLGFLGGISSGVVPVIKFAFWAMGDLTIPQEKLSSIRQFIPIESLKWLDILNEKHMTTFHPVWVECLSRIESYREFLKGKFIEAVMNGNRGNDVARVFDLCFGSKEQLFFSVFATLL